MLPVGLQMIVALHCVAGWLQQKLCSVFLANGTTLALRSIAGGCKYGHNQ